MLYHSASLVNIKMFSKSDAHGTAAVPADLAPLELFVSSVCLSHALMTYLVSLRAVHLLTHQSRETLATFRETLRDNTKNLQEIILKDSELIVLKLWLPNSYSMFVQIWSLFSYVMHRICFSDWILRCSTVGFTRRAHKQKAWLVNCEKDKSLQLRQLQSMCWEML